MSAAKKVLTAWGDDVALRGPDAPKNNGQIEHLIEYLLTVYERFGNTAVTTQLQWGATACWKRDEQAEKIAQLSTDLAEALAALREPIESALRHAAFKSDADHCPGVLGGIISCMQDDLERALSLLSKHSKT